MITTYKSNKEAKVKTYNNLWLSNKHKEKIRSNAVQSGIKHCKTLLHSFCMCPSLYRHHQELSHHSAFVSGLAKLVVTLLPDLQLGTLKPDGLRAVTKNNPQDGSYSKKPGNFIT